MNTDWSQFWPGIIATFVGFLLAITFQRFYDWRRVVQESKGLLKDIANELERVVVCLNKIDHNKAQVDPVKTPVWDAAVGGGKVSLIKGNIAKELFGIYGNIKTYNAWHLAQNNYFLTNNKPFDGIITQLNLIRTALLQGDDIQQIRKLEDIYKELQRSK